MALTFAAKKNWPLLSAIAIAILGVAVFHEFLNWNGLSFKIQLTDLTSLLAPLAFASAVIERAVEILISPWRDSDASKLEKAVAAIKARPADPAKDQQNAIDLANATEALDEYRGVTQRYAFAVSLTLCVLVSIAGVRALGPFADTVSFNDPKITSSAQRFFFLSVDVILSTAMLAGGADGIHSLVNAVTSFFNATAAKASA